MTEKRANGEGSIYQRKDGRWVGQYTVHTANGPKRRAVYGKDREEAARKLAGAIADRDRGLIFDAGNMTVGEYLDRWLSDSVRDTVKRRTFEGYASIVRRHLKPAIGRVKLAKLTPAHVQGLYRAKLDAGLSPTTVQHVHTTLHKALRQAVKWGLIPRNVCEAVSVPRRDSPEMRPLTPQQARVLLVAARGDRLEALYVLAVTTGMRQGELLGLRWRDVDLDRAVVRISQTLVTGNGKQTFEKPKTAKSRRSVALTRRAVAALTGHE
ncbi:MAG: site-specific integrase, partial [Actinomycetota bacterium]|nr:site-specific integrase [Actinomycetota bacterium]